MLLMIDNYDSFTYNLYQYLSELGAKIEVARNDKISLEEIKEISPEGIIISPGPSTPLEAGISNDVIRHFGPTIPTLGVCLAGEIRHGKTSMVNHKGAGVLAGLPNPFQAIRYHSLVVYPETIPDTLEVTAQTDNGLIMGLRHKEFPVEGVQFHPESILTPDGKHLLQNFLDKVNAASAVRGFE